MKNGRKGCCQASSDILVTAKGKGLDNSSSPLIPGAPGRIRTHDPLVRSQVLYPTELRAHCGTTEFSNGLLRLLPSYLTLRREGSPKSARAPINLRRHYPSLPLTIALRLLTDKTARIIKRPEALRHPFLARKAKVWRRGIMPRSGA